MPDWSAAVPGVAVCATWSLVLRSYRRISASKYAVILELERALPTRPYTDEWASLSAEGPRWWLHLELSVAEQLIPLVFGAIFVGLLVREAGM